jgi:hypothetical protein
VIDVTDMDLAYALKSGFMCRFFSSNNSQSDFIAEARRRERWFDDEDDELAMLKTADPDYHSKKLAILSARNELRALIRHVDENR